MAKLAGTLFAEGSFKMEIVNQGGVSSNQLPSNFEDVRALATSKNLLPNPYNG